MPHDELPGTPRPVVRHDEMLGQPTRVGTWAELSVGTYQAIRDALAASDRSTAEQLIRVTVEEAQELRDIFEVWPAEIRLWLADRGVGPAELAAAQERIDQQLLDEYGRHYDLAAEWEAYRADTEAAARACGGEDAEAVGALVEAARHRWQLLHDYHIDLVYGLLDCVVHLVGEERLEDVWNHLMRDWYDQHARRLDVRNQPWADSVQQLMTAIVHGFHGHLSGADRLGGMAYLEEADRVGFRFDPCGSGGRVIRDDTTSGRPRPAEPFGLAVTERPHPWAWNTPGIQAYCVHCCLLNMAMPIDRLGYPTRVVEPPTWPDARGGGTCTWWIYRDPSQVPEEVYARVGRTRPAALDGAETGVADSAPTTRDRHPSSPAPDGDGTA